MRRPNAALSALFATLCIAGCAATHVTPVSMTQPGDDQLTCFQLSERIANNRTAVVTLVRADKKVADGNAAKVAISVVPIAGLLAIASVDLSNEEQIRARSVIDRNERLIILAHSKGCSET
jgi:hypothetical protein